ncbi:MULTISPECIES: pitrilysin family protein [unclassified Curtobacterium]|uniref:M16 family metallopeptidase n=1 Tax=unclassified Curtobacterium TaxID=257496 RepID=UPI0008DCAD95|nr:MULTISPECIES: pitrilysin family protein [unclassified Curtobacterium]OIH98909.1 zinc protease [Curtobacterium sp. MCBA15_003]OII14539.1 zinc protease [Curtobacterium sp. MCBA15_009]OII31190.1 zinc protease [Curtobacterium sp. MMLR14_006]
MNQPVPLPLGAPDTSFLTSGGAFVRRTVLPSGVRVLSEAVPGAASTSIGFWVGVGSRDERDGQFGSTHFLEHLLFKGTETRSALDIAIAFDSVGGEHNAATAKEYTCYYARVRDTDVPMAIGVIGDMVTASVLDPDAFDVERGVILEELAMAADDPADVAGEAFFAAAFGGHPLGRPIGGTPDSIRAVGRDEVLSHYREHYAPNGIVVTAAGAVDHDRLCELVGQVFHDAPRADPLSRRTPQTVADPVQPKLSVVHRPTEQVSMLRGSQGLDLRDERRPALSVLNAVLGGGMSSRLFQEVRERRGLAYAVSSFAPAYLDNGAFGVYAGCAPDNVPGVIDIVDAEFRRMVDHGITADELRRAKGQIEGALTLSLEDSDARMTRLGRSELGTGEYTDLATALERVDRVTTDDVLELSRDLLTRPTITSVVGAVQQDELAAAIGIGS